MFKQKVIGCIYEESGDFFCENCRGKYYNSTECNNIRKDESDNYVLIYDKPEVDTITIFVVLHQGIITKIEVTEDLTIIDSLINEFLKENNYVDHDGHPDFDDYRVAEANGHLDTEFHIFSKEIIVEL